jgi:hypothetical protein
MFKYNDDRPDIFDDQYEPNELTKNTIIDADNGINIERFDSVDDLLADLFGDTDESEM